MIRLSLPLSQFFDIFRLDEPRVPQAIDDRVSIVHDDALDRELVVQDEIQSLLSIAALNTDGSSIFSFDQDHYIQTLEVTIAANPANLEYAYVLTQAFGQAQAVPIFFGVQAGIVTHTTRTIGGVASVGVLPNALAPTFPIFSRRETDYLLLARTNAGGGCDLHLRIRRTQAVAGVQIAR